MSLQQVIYASAAVNAFSEVDLSRLLLKARANNSALSVTGMLLYDDGSFLQVLEGEQANVEQLFERIGKDARHTRIMCLLRRTIDARQFREWAMGFVAVKQIAKNLPGYSDYLRHRGDLAKAGGLADRVLSHFREGRYRTYVGE